MGRRIIGPVHVIFIYFILFFSPRTAHHNAPDGAIWFLAPPTLGKYRFTSPPLSSRFLKMDRPKRKGGAENLREKKLKSLEADAAKCAKITDMFSVGAAAAVASSSSAVPNLSQQHYQQQTCSVSDAGQRDKQEEGRRVVELESVRSLLTGTRKQEKRRHLTCPNVCACRTSHAMSVEYINTF